MPTIQLKIARILIAQTEKSDLALCSLIKGMDEWEVCHIVFKNFRNNSEKVQGMRLTDEGLILMKSFFKSHDITFPAGFQLKPRHIIYLDRVCKMPYWVDNRYIALLDDEMAMVLSLSDFDLNNLIEMRFRLETHGNGLKSDLSSD